MKVGEDTYWTGNEIQREGYGNKIVGCSCGTKLKPGDSETRFLKRHPRLCSLRTAFNMRLASGTHCEDGDK